MKIPQPDFGKISFVINYHAIPVTGIKITGISFGAMEVVELYCPVIGKGICSLQIVPPGFCPYRYAVFYCIINRVYRIIYSQFTIAFFGKHRIVARLLEAGADPNHVDGKECSVLLVTAGGPSPDKLVAPEEGLSGIKQAN